MVKPEKSEKVSPQTGSGKGRGANRAKRLAQKNTSKPKFKGAEEGLEDYIFDVRRSDLYNRAIKEFIVYVGKKYKQPKAVQ